MERTTFLMADTAKGQIVGVADHKCHHRFLEIAREYGNPNLVSEPYYSTPENMRGLEDRYASDFLVWNPRDQMRSIALTTSILSLEWIEYMMSQIGADYKEDKFTKVKREVLDHYSSGKEISRESKKALETLKRNDITWVKKTKEEFRIRSMLLSFVNHSNKKFLDNL